MNTVNTDAHMIPDSQGGTIRRPVDSLSPAVQEPADPVRLECKNCGEPFDIAAILGIPTPYCPDCVDALREDRYREEQERKAQALEKARLAAWAKLCPIRFRLAGEDSETCDKSTNPRNPAWNADAWERVSRAPLEDGLGLISPTGRCKSRMAWLLLRREHMAGRSVFGVTAHRLADAIQRRAQDDESARTIRKARNASLLLLDDVGKNHLTPATEAGLFALVDGRYEDCRPIIWTANATAELASSFSSDRGEPLLRRLRDIGEPMGI